MNINTQTSFRAQRGFTYSHILMGVTAMAIAGVVLAGLVSTVVGGASSMSRSAAGMDALTHAVTTLVSEGTLDQDGVLLPPAGSVSLSCAASSEAPVADCWQVPASSKAPKVDAYGSNLGYCVWNHGTSNAGTGYLTGVSPATNDLTALAVLSNPEGVPAAR